jgi:hypothetical protein
MNQHLKEYLAWYSENKAFYEQLKSHQSMIYTRIYPVYDVLLYLYQEYKDETNINEDIDKIIQVGLEYLHQQIFTCKIYYEKFFDKDMHAFLEYDQVINYLLFIEDLKYDLVEKGFEYDQEALDEIIEELESYIENKKEIPDNFNLYLDKRLSEIISIDDQIHSIIDIFVEIASTLGIDLDEEEVVIGKEI